MKLGIICPSEIAFRRFMPALKKMNYFDFVGLSVNSVDERMQSSFGTKSEIEKTIQNDYNKALNFTEIYGGKIYNSYMDLITSSEIDAVYLPLPPALHYKWAKLALENNKHVLVEKPATLSKVQTLDLVQLARTKKLALHENYMFVYHKQIEEINNLVCSGIIGDLRLVQVKFGFPMRAKNDFRYNKLLGGGALIDAGGYTLKYASMLLGKKSKVVAAQMNFLKKFEVDIFGSGTLQDSEGNIAQISFGMDNDYKCELELWGSEGTLQTNRILTAPVGFKPTAKIIQNGVEKKICLSEDDSFLHSIEFFSQCIKNEAIRETSYSNLIKQADLVDEFKNIYRTENNL